MKVILRDMTIEGNPEEIVKFLSLKENNNFKNGSFSNVGPVSTRECGTAMTIHPNATI